MPEVVPIVEEISTNVNICMFGLQAVERAANAEGHKITYAVVKSRMGDLFYRLV
jgi:hypothetical protein